MEMLNKAIIIIIILLLFVLSSTAEPNEPARLVYV